MTNLDKYLSEVKARCEAATPGLWETGPGGEILTIECLPTPRNGDLQHQVMGGHLTKRGRADREFIAASRTDIPLLLAMIQSQIKHFQRIQDYYGIEAPGLMAQKALTELNRLAAGGEQ